MSRLPFLLSKSRNSSDSKTLSTALSTLDDDNDSVGSPSIGSPSIVEVSSSSSLKAKKCSFNLQANETHEIEHLNNVSIEELAIRWYSPEEVEGFKAEILSLFGRIKRKEANAFDLDEVTETLRGLEDKYCREKREQQKARKSAAEFTVLQHQEQFAWYDGESTTRKHQDKDNRSNVIAISYKLASRESKKLALELARQDAAFVIAQLRQEPIGARAKLGRALSRSLPKQLRRKLSSSLTSVDSSKYSV